MKKKIPFAVAVIAFLASCFPLAAQTIPHGTGLSASAPPSTGTSAAPSASTAKQNPRPLPFHGMVSAIDQKNKTFTISGKQATRAFKVTDKTVITKGAGAAKFSDIVDNQEVSGAYWTNPDGTLEAKMIKLGPTEKKTTTPSKPSPTPKP